MHKSAVLAASAALGLAFTYAGSVYSAPSIYPVDTARFLAGSRFDFKVEFDGKVNEKDVRVLINGKPAESVLGGKPGFVSEESGVGASAILLLKRNGMSMALPANPAPGASFSLSLMV